MEKAYTEGKTRAIGLSNFYDARFVDLVYHSEVVPAVNQLETNVFSQQNFMRDQLIKEQGILMIPYMQKRLYRRCSDMIYLMF